MFLKFEAISIHSEVYVNSVKVAEESCGSTQIFVEITDFIEENRQVCLAVLSDNNTREGWWYEGGGIFGHTYLIVAPSSYIEHNSPYAVPKKGNDSWNLYVEAKAVGGLRAVCEVAELGLKAECDAERKLCFEFTGINPELWSPENPKLYKLVVTLFDKDGISDKEEINIGFRECIFNPDNGFYLNGQNRKIKGICMHNDHAGVGIAMRDGIMEYRLKKLKEMGCDAIRTSHNPYVPEFYDLCDRMGFLVMDEVRHFSFTQECLSQLEKFVKRDRNHPSVIMWSIFNEENLQCTVRGKKIAQSMMRLIKSLDNTRPVGEWFDISQEEVVTIKNSDGSPKVVQKRKKRTFNTDPETFCGGINVVLSFLKHKYADKQIVLMTPIHRAFATFGNENIQYDEMYSNNIGLFIDDYVEKIREASSVWATEIIDLYSSGGLFPLFDEGAHYFSNAETDRLHPGTDGHRRIADVIKSKLNVIDF